MQAMWLMILALWRGAVPGNATPGCPQNFFPAGVDVCLHIAYPSSSPMEDYCESLSGKLYGRPVDEEMAKALATNMFEISQSWMPQEVYLGMERPKDKYGKLTVDWQFLGESDTFSAGSFKWWSAMPIPEQACAAALVKSNFHAVEFSCSKDIGSICERPDKPCYIRNIRYTNYHGVCSLAISDKKTFDAAKQGCEQGRLMQMTSENHYNSLVEAMYNSVFSGGIYIGLNKTGNGVWKYNNGDKEKSKWASDNDNAFDCGGVRLMFDKTLGYYSIPCDSERLTYLCEYNRKSTKPKAGGFGHPKVG